MIEGEALRFVLLALTGWCSNQRQAAVAYLVEEIEFFARSCTGDACG